MTNAGKVEIVRAEFPSYLWKEEGDELVGRPLGKAGYKLRVPLETLFRKKSEEGIINAVVEAAGELLDATP